MELKSKVEYYKSKLLFKTSKSYENDEKVYIELLQALENYQNHIWNMKNSTVEELKNRNYTDDQINAILNYDGSEEKMFVHQHMLRDRILFLVITIIVLIIKHMRL